MEIYKLTQVENLTHYSQLTLKNPQTY